MFSLIGKINILCNITILSALSLGPTRVCDSHIVVPNMVKNCDFDGCQLLLRPRRG